MVGLKVKQAQDAGLHSIVCIGETLEQREGGTTNDVLKVQLDAFLPSVSDWNRIVIAYEPVWAIGTGKTATPDMAQETHAYIRNWLNTAVSPEIAAVTRVQYGGSVNAANAGELIAQPDIDGFLVGGASLKPEFSKIIESVAAQHAQPAV